MLKKYLRISAILFTVMILVCSVSGCELFDEGEFTANGSLYDGITPASPESESEENENTSDNTDIEEPENSEDDTAEYEYVEPDKETAAHVTMTVKDYGVIKLELYKNIAPITVDNFVSLAEKGFYDGLTFHRVVSGFVVQGGDPEGTGMGGSGVNITGEFNVNGINNSLSHERGVISMARNSIDYDSASSQFFICHQDCSDSLDGQYAAFGIVTEGMDVVDKIAAVETDDNDKPLTNIVIESVKVEK